MKPLWLHFPPPLRIGIPVLVLLFSLIYDIVNTLVLMDGEVGRAYGMVEDRTKNHAIALADAAVFDLSRGSKGEVISRELQFLKSQNSDVLWAAVVDQSQGHRILYSTNTDWVGRTMAEVKFSDYAVAVVDLTVREPGVRHIKNELIDKSMVAFAPIISGGSTSTLVALVSRDYWRHVDGERVESIWEGATSALIHLIACLGLWWVLHRYLSRRLKLLHESIRDIENRVVTPTLLKGDDEYAQMSRLLWQSESIKQQLVNNIRDVIYLVSEDGRQIIYLSPAFKDIWGIEPTNDSLVLLELVYEEDRSRLRAMLGPLHQGRSKVSCEYRIKRPDGNTRWLESRAFPIRHQDGTIYRITGLMADITERKQLEQQILDISERERHRIGYDLHDDLCQRLAAIKLSSEMIETMIAVGKLDAAKSLAVELSKHLGDAATLCRSLARGLSPVNMDGGGFTYAIQKLVNTAGQLYKINCTFDCPEAVTINNSTTATHLYRIIQELINNAARHAKPAHIQVSLHKETDRLRVAVTNDGLEFIDKVQNIDGGMGLKIIRYRANAIDASIQFLPRTDNSTGTMAVCLVPLINC